MYLDDLVEHRVVERVLVVVDELHEEDGSPSCFFASAHDGSDLRSTITASITFSTALGGLAYALTSDMSFLLSSSSAFCAASSAGSALSRSCCASSAILRVSTSSLAIFSDSMLTCFCCSSTTCFSCTMTTSISSQSVCARATSFFFCSSSTDISATCSAVSVSFCMPFFSLSPGRPPSRASRCSSLQ